VKIFWRIFLVLFLENFLENLVEKRKEDLGYMYPEFHPRSELSNMTLNLSNIHSAFIFMVVSLLRAIVKLNNFP